MRLSCALLALVALNAPLGRGREGYTQPEIHELEWDLYMILDGSGTLLVGGEREPG